MKKKQTLAVTGLTGALGSFFLPYLQKEYRVIDLSRSRKKRLDKIEKVYCDLLDVKSIKRAVLDIKPDLILHLAAITHIDRCEDDRQSGEMGEVWKINVDASQSLAEATNEVGAYMLMLSSECVFDGKTIKFFESDKTCPKNWYGITKAKAEKFMFRANKNAAVLRSGIAYVYEKEEKTLFGKIFQAFKRNKHFMVVRDQYITPTYLPELLRVILKLLSLKKTGIYHTSSVEVTTPYLFAIKIAEYFNLNVALVKGVFMIKYFGKIKAQLRSKHACLDSRWTYKTLQILPLTIDEIFATIKE